MIQRLLSADDVRVLLREACQIAGSQSKWARQNGVSRQYVSFVLLGVCVPGPSVLKPLGVKIIKATNYVIDKAEDNG